MKYFFLAGEGVPLSIPAFHCLNPYSWRQHVISHKSIHNDTKSPGNVEQQVGDYVVHGIKRFPVSWLGDTAVACRQSTLLFNARPSNTSKHLLTSSVWRQGRLDFTNNINQSLQSVNTKQIYIIIIKTNGQRIVMNSSMCKLADHDPISWLLIWFTTLH